MSISVVTEVEYTCFQNPSSFICSKLHRMEFISDAVYVLAVLGSNLVLSLVSIMVINGVNPINWLKM